MIEELRLALIAREEAKQLADQAAIDRKAAEQARADAQAALGQVNHRHREIESVQKSIAAREQHLKAVGEPQLVAREAAVAERERKVEELFADWQHRMAELRRAVA